MFRGEEDVSDIGCNFLRLVAASSPLPSAQSLLVCVLVLAAAAAAVSPEVKQSAVIYQCLICPI